jgi:hypothetical protein
MPLRAACTSQRSFTRLYALALAADSTTKSRTVSHQQVVVVAEAEAEVAAEVAAEVVEAEVAEAEVVEAEVVEEAAAASSY